MGPGNFIDETPINDIRKRHLSPRLSTWVEISWTILSGHAHVSRHLLYEMLSTANKLGRIRGSAVAECRVIWFIWVLSYRQQEFYFSQAVPTFEGIIWVSIFGWKQKSAYRFWLLIREWRHIARLFVQPRRQFSTIETLQWRHMNIMTSHSPATQQFVTQHLSFILWRASPFIGVIHDWHF